MQPDEAFADGALSLLAELAEKADKTEEHKAKYILRKTITHD